MQQYCQQLPDEISPRILTSAYNITGHNEFASDGCDVKPDDLQVAGEHRDDDTDG